MDNITEFETRKAIKEGTVKGLAIVVDRKGIITAQVKTNETVCEMVTTKGLLKVHRSMDAAYRSLVRALDGANIPMSILNT